MQQSARQAVESSLAETYHERRLLRLLAMSRYLIGVAVVGTFAGATALLVYGVVETHALIRTVLAVWLPAAANSSDPPPVLAAIAAVDAFLVGVVLRSTDDLEGFLNLALAPHVNLDLTRLGLFARRQAYGQHAILVLGGDLRCIDR